MKMPIAKEEYTEKQKEFVAAIKDEDLRGELLRFIKFSEDMEESKKAISEEWGNCRKALAQARAELAVWTG
jgi:hypothetical protein